MLIRITKHSRRYLWVAAVFLLIGLGGCAPNEDATPNLIGTWTAQVEARFGDSNQSGSKARKSALVRIAYKFKYNDDLEIVNDVAGQATSTRLKWKVIETQADRVTIQTRTRGEGDASKLVGEIVIEFVDDDHFTRVLDDNGMKATFTRYRS